MQALYSAKARRKHPHRLAATGLILVVATVVTAAAAHAADRPEGSPLDPTGAWRLALIAAVVLGFAAYAAGSLLAARPGAQKRLVVAVAILVQLLPLSAPTLLSTDAYSYWAYGRVAASHSENPYRVPPEDNPGDPALERMGADWRDDTLVYGPVFAVIAETGARLAGDSASRAALFHRVLAAAAMLLIIALVYRAAPRPALGVVLVGWNPLLALHAAGGGHNDFPMMALATLGYVCVARGRPAVGGVAWVVAVGIKWSAGLLLPLLFVQQRLWRSRGFIAGTASGALALVIGATAAYGTAWLTALSRLSEQGRRTDGSLGFAPLLADAGLPHRAILVVLAIVLVAGYVWLLLQALAGQSRLTRGGELLTLTQAWVNPWYAALFMPFMAFERDRLAFAIALALTGYFLLDVLPI
jgi:hypothetical protein